MALPARGRHTAAYRIAELRREVRDLDSANTVLLTGTEDREREIHTALVRGCQDAMRIAQLSTERDALLKANEELRHKTIRAKAEQERLRRAVVNARPRIREVPSDMVRPYITAWRLPYLSAIPVRDTSNDETQRLPVVDWPSYPAT